MQHIVIRSAKDTDRREHILNIIMVVMVIICVAMVAFFVIRHVIELDAAASAVTVQELRRAGY